MTSVVLLWMLAAFFMGAASGVLFSRVLLPRAKKLPVKKQIKILGGQVWFMPGVGRCVVSNTYPSLGEISVRMTIKEPGTGRDTPKMAYLDLNKFIEEATLLALCEGVEEKPIPAEHIPDEDYILMLEGKKNPLQGRRQHA